MKLTVQKDLDPDPEFFYGVQFRIYHEPYLIWDRQTWKDVIATCDTFRIEVDGTFAGDIILEQKENGTDYIVDFSLLPEYQRKGIGRSIL